MAYQEKFMAAAVELARVNMNNGGGPFGAVVVKEGEIVGRGSNLVTNQLDPTAHAEVMAIRDACKNQNTFVLEGCEIYSSCEPCPMCLSAIYWAHIGTLYYGSTRHDAAEAGFNDSFIYHELSLPNELRTVKSEVRDRAVCQTLFELWREKEDRINY